MQKHLSRARQWALVDGGKGGGEREEREGESTDKYTQVQTRHNKTQKHKGKKGILYEGNPKVGESRSPDIVLQGEVGVLNIQ